MRNFTIGEKILPVVRRYNLDKGLFLSLIMIASLFVTTPLKAQAVVDIFNLPDPERCTSNDLRVVEASLDFDQCGPTCEEGEVIEYPLTLAIFNNTGSLRTSFAFYSRLEQYDSEGNLTNTYFITGCRGPVPPNTTTEITFDESLVILDENGDPTSFEGVPYLCGGSLKLINLYEAWTDASDNENRQCPLDPSKINPKCGVLQSIEIQTPLSAFVESTADVTCFGSADGSIDITVAGGEEPYTFVWTRDGNGFSASTEDLINIPAGTYNVTVTDSQGCSETLEDIIVGSPDVLDADVDSDDVTCYGESDGSITITNPSGGSGNYEFSIDGGSSWQASGSFTGLSADTYSVFIRDADNTDCFIDLGDEVIDEPDILDADVDSENATCFEESDGSITITNPSGGSGNYEFSIDGGSSWQASGSFTGLSPDTYSVFIRDADNTDCFIDLGDITITRPDELEVTLVDTIDISCFGFEDGAIDITVSGGTPPYNYDWADLAGTDDPEDRTGLGGGGYSVTVTDDNGCVVELGVINLEEPLELSVDPVPGPESCEFNDGSITVNVTGGTAPYQYSIDGVDYQMSNVFTGLAAGDYTVYTIDANDCTSEDPVTIAAPENCVVDEGCTLGYWKNHTDRWCDAYSTCDIYGDIFEDAPAAIADLTLLEVLNLGGGGIYNLARQSVAALLNTCSSEVDFAYSDVEALINDVNEAFINNEAGSFGTQLDELNQAGCPLGGTSATTAPTSPDCDATAAILAARGFSAAPVPFVDQLSIQYHFNYVSNVNIQFFNLSGKLLQSFKYKTVTAGNITDLNVGAFVRPGQIYIIKVNTDKESFSKTIISSE